MGTNRVYTARNAVGSLCGPIEAGAPKSRRKTFRNVGSIVRQRSDFLHLADAARVAAVGLDDVEHFFELYDPPGSAKLADAYVFYVAKGGPRGHKSKSVDAFILKID